MVGWIKAIQPVSKGPDSPKPSTPICTSSHLPSPMRNTPSPPLPPDPFSTLSLDPTLCIFSLAGVPSLGSPLAPSALRRALPLVHAFSVLRVAFLRELRALAIADHGATTRSAFARLAGGCEGLEVLELDVLYCGYTPGDGRVVVMPEAMREVAKGCRKQRELRMRHCVVGFGTTAVIAEMKMLELLDLSHTNVADDALSSVLPALPLLLELHLAGCKSLTPEFFAEFFSRLHYLTVLGASETNFCAIAVAGMPRRRVFPNSTRRFASASTTRRWRRWRRHGS
mmetsp:Transcript_22096/g.58821  ORF Transcript_22096/g.58821 Transcript_22096/m.58821 type:complete len:283 (+) Transcript_22096:27-875(+)